MSPPRPGPSWLLLTASALAALAAWLFLPRDVAVGPSRPALRVALVDASASVARARGWLPWVRAELRGVAHEAQAAGEELALLSYADGVATAFPPGAPGAFLERLEGRSGTPLDPAAGIEAGATRLADGLASAAALLAAPGRAPGKLVLLGPGSTTGPSSASGPSSAQGSAQSSAQSSPAAALARVRATGAALEQRVPPPCEESDLGLLGLQLAARVEAGAPIVAIARLVLARGAAPPGPASLLLEVQCAGVTRSLSVPVPLPPRSGVFELPIDCGAAGFGRNQVRARCRLENGADLMPENDEAGASTLAEGARVIGIACTPELEPAARAWATPSGVSSLAGLQFVFLRPEDLLHELEGLTALVSFDLAPTDLPEALLRSFVQRGGGWLALSGWRLLTDWIPGAPGAPLARLLPVEPAQGEVGPRDVVLLVDGSGSMEGEAFESVRAATLELVSAALPSDRVSLRFFTVKLEREHVLKRRVTSRAEGAEAAREAARDILALRVPAGRTFLLRSLGRLAEGLGQRETLVLLLTDGWERDALPDEVGLARTCAEELAGRRARLVVIAVGDANLRLLAALAGGEERVRSGRSLEELRAIFHRELHGARLAEGELALRFSARAPGSLADAVSSAAAREQPLETLERFVRNRLRPGAEALWESEEGEPVLALTRAGLGRTALFASRPTPGWAARWSRAGLGQPAEFEGLLRWLARGPERAALPRARLQDGRLSVSGLDPGIALELEARLIDLADPVDLANPDRSRELLLLASAGPGQDVRRVRAASCRGCEAFVRPLLLVRDPHAPDGWQALALERVPRAEFTWDERVLPSEWFDSPRHAADGAVPGARLARSRAGAPWVLAAALGLLFWGGLAVARGHRTRFGGQGSRVSGR